MNEIQKMIAGVTGKVKNLNEVIQTAPDHPAHFVIEDLEEITTTLEAIKQRCFLKIPRQVTYAIGIEHQPNEFGFIAGPVLTLRSMLEHQIADPDYPQVPAEKICLIRFEGTQGEPINKVLYRFSHQKGWVRQV